MDDSQDIGAGDGGTSDAGLLLAGRYRLTEAIGSGGMGRVWRAQDELLHRTVAVKELTAGLFATEAERDVLHGRTRTEARAAARISHPNVVTVHDVLEYDGRPWIVMQYVDGRSLSEAVKASGPVDAREAARIGLDVLGALRAAHAAGVLHRDVKPANVMLSRDGQVLLTDFGIAAVEGDASVTRTGELVGSVEYLAPERVQGRAPGPESDLWALGATLYTAVQGISPFHRNSAISTLQAVIIEQVPYPEAAGALGPVIVALLAKDPGERPDAAACARLLRDAAEGRFAGTGEHPTRWNAPGAEAQGFTAPLPPYTPGGAPSGARTAPHVARSGTHQMPAPAQHRPPPAGPTAGASGGRPPRRSGRWRTAVAAIAAAVVIGAGIGFAVTRVGDGADDTPQANGTAGTAGPGTASPSSDSGRKDAQGGSANESGDSGSSGDTTGSGGRNAGTPSVPDGWEQVTAPEGFSLWVPKGWKRVGGVDTIDYSPDGDDQFIRVSVDRDPDFPTPLDHLENLEGSGGKVGTLPDYRRITLGPDTYRDQKQSARWEFTWTQDASQGTPGPRRAADEMYYSDDSGAEYAIYVSGPASDWDPHRFDTVLRGWQPPPD